MKNLTSPFAIGCILVALSYFLPWITAPVGDKSWSGNNISDTLKYFTDGKDFAAIFNLTHLVFAGSLLTLFFIFKNNEKKAKQMGLIISIIGLICYFIINLGLKPSFEYGYMIGIAGLGICLLQTFVPFLRKPLMKDDKQ